MERKVLCFYCGAQIIDDKEELSKFYNGKDFCGPTCLRAHRHKVLQPSICLKCDKEFKSEDPSRNRVCRMCKTRNSEVTLWPSMDAYK